MNGCDRRGRRVGAFALVLAAVLALLPACSFGFGGQSSAAGSNPDNWMSVDQQAKTFDITVIGGRQQENAGPAPSQDGYFRILVPVGWTLRIHYSVDKHQQARHNFVVVPWSAGTSIKDPAASAAFAGAVSKNPDQGLKPGESQLIRFKVDKPGHYRVVCSIPGQSGGHWGTLDVVTKDAKMKHTSRQYEWSPAKTTTGTVQPSVVEYTVSHPEPVGC